MIVQIFSSVWELSSGLTWRLPPTAEITINALDLSAMSVSTWRELSTARPYLLQHTRESTITKCPSGAWTSQAPSRLHEPLLVKRGRQPEGPGHKSFWFQLSRLNKNRGIHIYGHNKDKVCTLPMRSVLPNGRFWWSLRAVPTVPNVIL